MCGLAFHISGFIDQGLASQAKELAMDATFGANNMGMGLYAVLAEVDGTSVSILSIPCKSLRITVMESVMQIPEQQLKLCANSGAHSELLV